MKRFLFALAACLSMTGLQAETCYPYDCQPVCCDEWGKISIGADWLYWETEQAGLNYGTEVSIDVDANSQDNDVLRPKSRYENGFRVFADYTTVDNVWAFKACYTYAPTKSSSSFTSTGVTDIGLFNSDFPLLGALAGTTLNSLDSSFHSKVNCFDLDVARTFSLCNGLEIYPHLGLRALWVRQTLSLDGTSLPEIGPGLLTMHSDFKHRFAGVGVEGGIKGVWQFYDNFSLVGHVGGSVLYARYRTTADLGVGTNGVDEFTADFKDSTYRGVPTFDAFIGLQYAATVCDFGVNIHAGWEQHIIYQSTDYHCFDGPLTLQGLTLGAAVTF